MSSTKMIVSVRVAPARASPLLSKPASAPGSKLRPPKLLIKPHTSSKRNDRRARAAGASVDSAAGRAPPTAAESLTERMFKEMEANAAAGDQGGCCACPVPRSVSPLIAILCWAAAEAPPPPPTLSLCLLPSRAALAGRPFAASGAGGTTTYEALKRADAAWKELRTRTVRGPPQPASAAWQPSGRDAAPSIHPVTPTPVLPLPLS